MTGATFSKARAAVVQFEAVHEEVVESLRTALTAHGVEVSVFLNERVLERGALFGAQLDGTRVHHRPLDDAAGREALAEEIAGYDLLVLNTFQRDGQARWARQLGLPTLGVVHNPPLFLSQGDCLDLVRSGQAVAATLAPHCTAALMLADHRLLDGTVTLSNTMWEAPAAPGGSGRVRFGVPGAAVFDNRDLQGVVEVVAGLPVDLRDRLEVAVLGGGRDRAALEELVHEAGVGDAFWFAPLAPGSGFVPHDVAFAAMAGSDYLLPALPPDRTDYRTLKITSAVPASVALAVPAVLDRWTAAVYDVPCVDHPVGALEEGIRAALDQTTEERAELVDRLRERHDRDRRSNVEQVGLALERLATARTPRTSSEAELAARDAAERDDFLRFVAAVLPHSYAQRFQDLWALWETGFASEGWFVEFGALNGRDFSNTYLLEQLGWQGAVAEPHPDFAAAVRRHRSCFVSTKCVLDVSGATVDFHAVKGRPALSTAGGFGTDDARGALREEHVVHRVETTTLDELLREAEAPRTIDFLSVDTEGSEVAILRAFDFAAWRVERICVEHNDHQRDELHALLTAQGYRRKWPDLSGHDDWYVHTSLTPSRSPAAEAALAHRLQRVAPSGTGWEQRRALAESLVPDDVAVTPLPASALAHAAAGSTGTHAVAMTRATTRQVARVVGLPEDVYARRVRAAFRRLCRGAEPEQVLEVGTGPFGFAGWAAEQLPECHVVALDLAGTGTAPAGVEYLPVEDPAWRAASAAVAGLWHAPSALRVDGGPEALRVLEGLRDLLPSCDVVGVVTAAASDERPTPAGRAARLLAGAGLHLALADVPTDGATMQVFVHDRLATPAWVARTVAQAFRPLDADTA